MRKIFRSIDEVLSSGITANLAGIAPARIDRVLKSTRIEDKIYAGLRECDTDMDMVEGECTAKLASFPALSRDIFQSFYSLSVRRNDDGVLSDVAKRFNSHILDRIMNGEEYPAIKSACEGRQLPAYDAAAEFISNISKDLDDLLKEAGGDKGTLNTLEKLERQAENLMREFDGLAQSRDSRQAPDPGLDRELIEKANMAASKSRQANAVGRQVRDNLIKNQEKICAILVGAARSAAERAVETAAAIDAWGAGSGGPDPEKMRLDREVVNRVRKSPALAEAAKHLGRFREMAAKARKNGYAYGRGEKYTIEHGSDLRRVLTSEFSLLAVPAATPLFIRKYQNKGLLQYKRREPVFKGAGDIVMCLDESGSTRQDAPWGKAVALALLDCAMAGGRKFALIHFSSGGNYKTDLFLPGGYGNEEVFAAVETFLHGGTDFETPLKEAMRLIENEGFEGADVVFVTDGICDLPNELRGEVAKKKAAFRFKITGVVMDAESPGMDFSLKPFCEEILRTSELARDSIVEMIISARV